MRLGEVLLKNGKIEQDALSNALEIQAQEKSPLGKILVGYDHVRNFELYQAIAESLGLQFVDLIKKPPMREILRKEDREDYFRYEVLPYKIEKNSVTLAVCSINNEIKDWALERFPAREIKFVITSPTDIRATIQNVFIHEDDLLARMKLWLAQPIYSARTLFVGYPYKTFALITALVFSSIINPEATVLSVVAMLNVVFLASIIFKIFTFVKGSNNENVEINEPENLPIYSILLPLYKEKETLPQLINSIQNLDYPKSKLDVKFIVEADDYSTIQAIKNIEPPSYMEIIKVPYSLPRTKPKACNYALQYIRGEYVTIFDAEDKPHKSQLKAALAKFAEDKNIACVQARLNYYNHADSQVTKWFALEYAIWFNHCMKGFSNMGIAIPLGGTSNHIRTDILKEIGGWDAFNVTEDADLGMRLAREGYKTYAINSLTEEEAPNSLGAWFKQRRRWIKGFMQTYIVHMRKSVQLMKKLGAKGFLGFQFFIGAPILVYLSAPMLPLLLYSVSAEIPKWLYGLMMLNLVFGAISHILMAKVAAYNYRNNAGEKPLSKNNLLSFLTFPLYFILHNIAAYQALYQLITDPHYWDKTQHGKAKNV